MTDPSLNDRLAKLQAKGRASGRQPRKTDQVAQRASTANTPDAANPNPNQPGLPPIPGSHSNEGTGLLGSLPGPGETWTGPQPASHQQERYQHNGGYSYNPGNSHYDPDGYSYNAGNSHIEPDGYNGGGAMGGYTYQPSTPNASPILEPSHGYPAAEPTAMLTPPFQLGSTGPQQVVGQINTGAKRRSKPPWWHGSEMKKHVSWSTSRLAAGGASILSFGAMVVAMGPLLEGDEIVPVDAGTTGTAAQPSVSLTQPPPSPAVSIEAESLPVETQTTLAADGASVPVGAGGNAPATLAAASGAQSETQGTTPGSGATAAPATTASPATTAAPATTATTATSATTAAPAPTAAPTSAAPVQSTTTTNSPATETTPPRSKGSG